MTRRSEPAATESARRVDALLRMSKADLDELFSKSTAGEIPQYHGRGTVIFAPGSPIARPAAGLAYALAWRGKVVDRDEGELLNLVSPFGLQAVRAQVYKGPSWMDQRECIVIDYSKTSFVARWIRDELREVSPGVYLGQAFWTKTKLFKFVLVFPRT